MSSSGWEGKTASDRRRLEDEAIDLLVAAHAGGRAARGAQHALEAWRLKSPEHARAVAKAEDVWGKVGAGHAGPSAWSSPRQSRQRRATALRVVALAAAVLALVVFTDDARLLLADHQTRAGELKTIALPDGSSATLNTASAIDLEFGSDRRHVQLLTGEALFEVEADPARPFVVETPEGTVRVMGTVFSVRSIAGETRVKVAEGAVTTTPAAAPEEQINTGEGLTFTENRTAKMAVQQSTAFAWREGRLIFNSVPLKTVISELDRYYSGMFVLVGGDFGERLVSAVFRSDEPLAALEHIAQRFGLRVVRMPGLKVISVR
ncbi:MAG: FecR domain-containing protein [Pseudomonadota bacterium]